MEAHFIYILIQKFCKLQNGLSQQSRTNQLQHKAWQNLLPNKTGQIHYITKQGKSIYQKAGQIHYTTKQGKFITPQSRANILHHKAGQIQPLLHKTGQINNITEQGKSTIISHSKANSLHHKAGQYVTPQSRANPTITSQSRANL
jgi:hypothetical protein